ncbi:type IV secretion system protein TraC [Photobacterium damselae subsp. damselae]|uniref:Type IV secretion system protein TraC n=1 Tax=Photobacterium damselae subsp. damselae TaxID=85581 RepID=A0A850QZG1_PHODD|nr:type IV secretion system protein TraC [Photobacterium damselae subsp. damselae]
MDYKFKENDAKKLFRPLAYDKKTKLFLNDDLTLGFSFICRPLSGWDTELMSSLELMLRDHYPAKSMISVSLFSSPNIKETLKKCDDLRFNLDNPLALKAHNSMLGFLWDGRKTPVELSQMTVVKDYQVIVTFKSPVGSLNVKDSEISSVVKIRRVMKSRLEKSGLYPIAMDNEMYVNVLHTMLHWNNDAEWLSRPAVEVDLEKPINEQILQYDTKIKKNYDGVTIQSHKNNTIVKMLTIRRWPRNTRIGRQYLWYGDPFDGHGAVTQPFIITLNIQYPDHQKIKESMGTKANAYTKMAFGQVQNFVPLIGKMKRDLDNLTESLQKHVAVKATLSVACFGADEEDAEAGLAALQTQFTSQGTTLVRESAFAVPSFINLLPFGADSESVDISQRYSTLSSHHILPMLPIMGDWKGTGTPVLMFVSRLGQLMSVDLFDSQTNFNTIIYAESGAGKSVLGNEIIRSYLSIDAKIWAIDAGESYKKLSSSFNGNFIAFSQHDDISVNPFTMINEDDPDAFNEALEPLTKLIAAMAFSNDIMTDYQYKAIEKILIDIWNTKGSSMLIDDVAEACLSDEDSRIRDVGRQLYSFTTNGQYGRYFDKPHNVTFRGNFNILELDGLSKNPALQSVVLYLLVVQIQQEMYEEYKKDRTIKRIILIDEAWQLLGNSPTITEFMELTARRARKYNGALIIITQSILDLQKSSAGRAIAENAANSLILQQKESTITSAEKDNLMSLPDVGYRLLRKVVSHRGVYSEIFFNTGAGMGIGRLIVDPHRIMMYSTNAKDNSLIDSYLNQGLSIPQALERVIADSGAARHDLSRPAFLDFRRKQLKSDFNLDIYFDPHREGEKLLEKLDKDIIINERVKKDVA